MLRRFLIVAMLAIANLGFSQSKPKTPAKAPTTAKRMFSGGVRVEVRENFNGKTFSLRMGTTLRVSLLRNSNGYSWRVLKGTGPVLRRSGGGADRLMNAKGKPEERLYNDFDPIKPGLAKLQLGYCKGASKSPLKTFKIQVNVKPGAKR